MPTIALIDYTLLDFSRLEAGRVQAFYELTDLAAECSHPNKENK